MSEKIGQSRRRLRLARAGFGLVVVLILFSRPALFDDPVLMRALFWSGFGLIIIGAMGRFYTMTFIAGLKNKTVVDYGPFSLCRNPLYFFSLCGVCGIGLMTGSLLLTAFMLLMFCISHIPQIRHEERSLYQKFGQRYADYRSRTPSFIPNLSLYQAPQEISIKPKVLNKALRDASAWFVYIPVISAVHLSQAAGLIEPMIELI